MSWKNANTWPAETEGAFRSEAIEVERDFPCRRLRLKERFLITRHHPASSQIVARFCLTNRALYAETQSGNRKVITRNQIDTLEVRGAYLAIGTRDSVLFYAPDHGEENHEALLKLVATRPRVLPARNRRGLVLALLPVALLLAAGVSDLLDEALQRQRGYSVFDDKLLIGLSICSLALLVAAAMALAFFARRRLIDTRGVVEERLFRTQYLGTVAQLIYPPTQAKVILGGHTDSLARWFFRLLPSLVVTCLLAISAAGVLVVATHLLPARYAVYGVAAVLAALGVLLRSRSLAEVTIDSEQISISRRMSAREVSFDMKDASANGDFLALLLGSVALVVQRRGQRPIVIPLAKLRPQSVPLHELAPSLSALWQIPVITMERTGREVEIYGDGSTT